MAAPRLWGAVQETSSSPTLVPSANVGDVGFSGFIAATNVDNVDHGPQPWSFLAATWYSMVFPNKG